MVLVDFPSIGSVPVPVDGSVPVVVDDVVMGGRSRSRFEPYSRGTSLFSGFVSLEDGGGFASVRMGLPPTDFSEVQSLKLRVRGDGRVYQLRLRSKDAGDGLGHGARFPTTSGRWEIVTISLSDFEATFRGRPVPGARPLRESEVYEIGVLISNRQEGPFRLEIDWVRAMFRVPAPPTAS
jgi:NADH dehydrogenase [ubiquinone] 1 alpha subcomplex assembly factor 1